MTNCTSASTDVKPAKAGLWNWSGVSWLVFLTAGLLIGLWPELAFKPKSGDTPVTLPAIQTLSIAQVAWIFLIYPIVISGRIAAGRRFSVAATVLELLGLLIVAVPYYICVLSVSDAALADLVRAFICWLCLLPLAISLGAALAGRATAAFALVIMLAFGVVSPMVFYFTHELTPSVDADWIWLISPPTAAWNAAAPEGGSFLPFPYWPMVAWFVVAAAIGLVAMAGRRIGKRGEANMKNAEDNNGLR